MKHTETIAKAEKVVAPKRVSNLFTFYYGALRADGQRRALPQLRVDDKPLPMREEVAKAAADAIMEAGGILCGDCLGEFQVRFVRSDDPTVARCYPCHDAKQTGSYYHGDNAEE